MLRSEPAPGAPPSLDAYRADAGSVRELIRAHARSVPHAAAILAPDRPRLTYAALDARIDAFGSALARFGITRRDRVALVAHGPDLAVALLATSCHAVAAPLSPLSTADELRNVLRGLGASAVVVQDDLDTPARQVAVELGLRVLECCDNSLPEATLDTLDPGSSDLALILHTSGTTGQPHRVPFTHSSLCVSARTIARSLELGPDDRCLNPMPLHHGHGLIGGLLASLAAGAATICVSGYSAADLLDWLEDFAPTWYTAVPTIHRAILDAVRQAADRQPNHSLRFIRSCSSPLSPELMQQLESSFGVPVVEAYGMTETTHQIASNPLPPSVRKPGSVGIPTGTHVQVIDAAGQQVPPGVQGEIVVSGLCVMRGYLDDQVATDAVFHAAGMRSGDLGFVDADGYLFLVGRLKEIINRGGESISPHEVERVLLLHPGVADAAVFGVPTRASGKTSPPRS